MFTTAQWLLANNTYTTVPGLTQTFIVPPGSVVYLSTDGVVACSNLDPGCRTVVDIALSIDGADPAGPLPERGPGLRRLVASNAVAGGQSLENWSFERTLVLAAGTHTVQVMARLTPSTGTPAIVGGPSTSALQSQLTVMLIRQ